MTLLFYEAQDRLFIRKRYSVLVAFQGGVTLLDYGLANRYLLIFLVSFATHSLYYLCESIFLPMGVIGRQGIKSSFIQYVGVLIGALSTLFIYPLDYAAYGLAQTCLDLVIFLSPLVTFGGTHLTVRFFPHFRQSGGKDNGYLGALMVIILSALVVSGVLAYFFGSHATSALEWLGFNLELFAKYKLPLTLFVVVHVLILLFDNYTRNYNRIALQSIFTSILPKLGLPALILLLYFQRIDSYEFVWGIVLVYLFALIGLIIYASRVTAFDFKIKRNILSAELRREMATYAAYTTFGAMGAILATQMDSLMISTLINTESTGIYKIIAFMAIVIEVPARSIRAISSPVIAESWKKQDLKEIDNIYTRSSAILGFVGTALFVIIAINIEDIISWTPNPEEMMASISVFYLLGFARLIDMFTGVNSQLITFSDYFRFSMVAIFILAILNLTFNYYFIVQLDWGITGVALSTLISLFLYNLSKFLFILVKMKMQPLSMETVKILVLGVLGFSTVLLPIESSYSLINVGLRSLLVVALFWAGLRYAKICPEINSVLNKSWSKLMKALSK